MSTATPLQQKQRREHRTRARLNRTRARPRLSIFRSNRYVYAQVIDDATNTTLAQANSRDLKVTKNVAEAVGKAIAEAAKAAGVSQVVFDRGSYRYTGAIKRLADSARENGLEF